MTTKPEAERIAAAINVLRPAWATKSIETLILDQHHQRPARDVLLALAYLALDPDTQTPARINTPGPWWDYQIPTTPRPPGPATLTPPRAHQMRCPIHGQTGHPCPTCKAEERPATAERTTAMWETIANRKRYQPPHQPTLDELEQARRHP